MNENSDPRPLPSRRGRFSLRQLLLAITAGLISRDYAIRTYRLSEEELTSWERLVGRYGTAALKATTVQRYRQPEGEASELP